VAARFFRSDARRVGCISLHQEELRSQYALAYKPANFVAEWTLPHHRNPGAGQESEGAHPQGILRSEAVTPRPTIIFSMAGYSGTPLAKSWAIKDDFRAACCTCRTSEDRTLRSAWEVPHPTHCQQRSRFYFPFCQIAARGSNSNCCRPQNGAGPCGHAVDLVAEEKVQASDRSHGNVIRQSGLDAGLVDVKVCAVTHVWSD